MKFSEYELHDKLMQSLGKLGFTDCTPIQEACMSHILAGKDVAGLAQTGTGKTAAFAIPLIHRLLSANTEIPENDSAKRGFQDWKERHFVLVLVPTRELAEQVSENIKKLTDGMEYSTTAIYGGTSYEPQKKAINDGAHFVVATPGRLIDLFKEDVIDLNLIRAVVFDEADRMFDMGFKDDMKFILKRIPRDRQFLVFSATLNFDVLNVAYEFGSTPIEVNVSKDQARAENVKDEIFHAGDKEKPQFLLSILKRHNPKQAIIFSNFKSNVDRISKFLNKNGLPTVGISSLLSQSQRNRVMEQFKSAEAKQNILVATDVAARGLDIKGVDLVCNYELPDDPENYVHRIGRTGRAGETGVAYSMVSDRDVDALARIEEYLGNKIESGWIDDSELVTDFVEFEKCFDRPEKGPKKNFKKKHDGPRSDKPHHKKPGSKKKYDKKDKPQGERKTHSKDEHRDRKTGRHKTGSANAKNSNGKFQDKNKRNKVNKKSNTKKSVYKSKPRSQRFDPSRGKASQSASLGQKISSFFKNLLS